MGGRIAVLQFDDSEAFKLFLNTHKDSVGVMIGEYYLPPEPVYCRCPGTRNVSHWVRHPKFGLWTCRQCHKPAKHWRRGILARLEVALGLNLRRP